MAVFIASETVYGPRVDLSSIFSSQFSGRLIELKTKRKSILGSERPYWLSAIRQLRKKKIPKSIWQ